MRSRRRPPARPVFQQGECAATPHSGCVRGDNRLDALRMNFLRSAGLLVSILILAGCESTLGPSKSTTTAARAGMLDALKAEPPGAYFVGRRYYKTEYKFWGYVRASGQPWTTAKLVVLNENQKLAPDRSMGKLGADNDFEYKLIGNFSGETVYEPASNGLYPEFILRGFELRSQSPAPIYRERAAVNPEYRIIAQPY